MAERRETWHTSNQLVHITAPPLTAPMGNAPEPTSGTSSVRLIAVGDTGSGSDGQRQLARAMGRTCRALDCRGVLLLGDNFYPEGVTSTQDPLWERYFESVYATDGLVDVPFFAVFGNHDYGPLIAGSKQAQLDYAALDSQRYGDGARFTMPSAYYVVHAGPIDVFALDTMDLSQRQASAMRQATRESKARFRVAFGHHPRLTSGRHRWRSRMEGYAGLYPLLDSVVCDVDLYIAGHDHNLEFIEPGHHPDCSRPAFATSGAGSMPRRSYAEAERGQLYFNDEQVGAAVIEATTDQLRLSFIDGDANTLFEYEW